MAKIDQLCQKRGSNHTIKSLINVYKTWAL
jgi:hypothetical protein